MATCLRCSECRKTFTPSTTTGARQKVCGPECRRRRDRRLARRRRLNELTEYREDERRRQRVHRAKGREGSQGPVCHAPASGCKLLDLREKVVVFVDRALARSRASLLRDLAEVMPEASDLLARTG